MFDNRKHSTTVATTRVGSGQTGVLVSIAALKNPYFILWRTVAGDFGAAPRELEFAEPARREMASAE